MLVKCNYCQEKIDKKGAFSPTGKTPWFCSEEHYERFTKDNKDKRLLNEYVYDLFGLDNGADVPLLKKKLSDLMKVYSAAQILNTFEGKEKDIRYWLTRTDKLKTAQSRIAYIFAIIGNAIMDYPVVQNRKEIQDNTDVELLVNLNNQPKRKTCLLYTSRCV